MARAMRREEIPLLEKKYEEDSEKDKIFWEQQEEEKVLGTVLLDCNIHAVLKYLCQFTQG